MRQGQQNRRGRGRGRKPQNPLSRNYESNGPDVKIRGTAAHIAEKYSSLARDAFAASDIVTAENYYQHAEHYSRIIMTAQEQSQSGSGQQREGARDDEVLNGAAGQQDQPIVSEGDHGGDEAPKVSASAERVPAADNANGRRRRRSNGSGRQHDRGDEGRVSANAASKADSTSVGFAGLPPSSSSSEDCAKPENEPKASAGNTSEGKASEKKESVEASDEVSPPDNAVAS